MERAITDLPKIVCVGSNMESEVALRALLDAGAAVSGLVTLPVMEDSQRPSDFLDLHPIAEKAGITVIDTIDVNSEETLARIRALAPDYIFALGWSQIFGQPLLEIPSGFVVGSHPSPLPRGRGRAPVPWTILQRMAVSAVTLFRMDPGADTGPILIQRWFHVADSIYALDLYRLTAEHLAAGYIDLYERICRDAVEAVAQDEALATYRAKRSPLDGHLDFSLPARDLERLIRAVSRPYPGAYTYYGEQKIVIQRAGIPSENRYVGTAGQILVRDGDRLLVQCGDDALWLEDLSDDATGQPMEGSEFRVGSRFGLRVEDELVALKKALRSLSDRLDALISE